MSDRWCVVASCNSSVSEVSKRSFFQFPKNDDILQKWVQFVRKTKPQWNPGLRNVYTCSNHFNKEDFSNYRYHSSGLNKKLILKKTAAPSIYPNTSSSISDADEESFEYRTHAGCSKVETDLIV